MKKLRVGINGFGRIGRNATRIALKRPDLEIVAVNSRADAKSHAYLLKYDSTYGTLSEKVEERGNDLYVNNQKISVYQENNPDEIPWEKDQVDVVIDSTGIFRTKDKLSLHLKRGVKYVVLSAPAKDETKTLVMGVNHDQFNKEEDKVISNSSCTTNCLATTLKIVHENFQVIDGFMTTIHAVTDTQNLLDNSHKKSPRLRRAAFASMIPSSTGSAADIGKLYPELSGKIICKAMRIPIQTVSLIDLTVRTGKKTNREEVNKAYDHASATSLKGILTVSREELVSIDYKANPYSSVVDTFLTDVNNENLVKIYAWYDNEWGYASRLVDMVTFVSKGN